MYMSWNTLTHPLHHSASRVRSKRRLRHRQFEFIRMCLRT